MKNLILFVILLPISHIVAQSQSAFDPRLLILSPREVSFDPSLKPEIDKKNDELKLLTQSAQNGITNESGNDQPQNITLMRKSAIKFATHIDIFNQISLYAQDYLIYRFYEKFPNCLVLLKDEKSKVSLQELQRVASEEQTSFILNIPKISFYKSNGETKGIVQVQLYQTETNALLLDQEYTGDWNSHGFEWTCETGSIGCCINNSLSHALPDVIFQIASHNQTLMRERQIAAQRSAFIKSTVFPCVFNPSLIRNVIMNDASVHAENLYQGFYNNDSTKFVGFFLKHVDEKYAKALLDQKGDQNVTVITSKDIHDTAYLNQKARTYAYIVKAVKYQNRWFYEKAEVTYFNASDLNDGKVEYLNNLQGWDFFKPNSTQPNDSFWEGHLFKKVADKRKDPKWEKYKDIWESEEREDRPYIELYEIVADKLKEEEELATKTFKAKTLKDVLIPFYQTQTRSKANLFFKVKDSENFILIYPKDKHVILNPVKVTNQQGIDQIRYFVLLPSSNEIFEWTLVKPYTLAKGEYTDDPINKTLGVLTKWTFANKTLDDSNFWDEKVLKKEGNDYKYLKKLK